MRAVQYKRTSIQETVEELWIVKYLSSSGVQPSILDFRF